ncbi:MAG: putative metalloprotease CJM1_0395 family protein [Oleiphilaceae bacterium]|nr:putative metalloprotease CJM1_0395 family protein [Oleiphilaceae bacterium]
MPNSSVSIASASRTTPVYSSSLTLPKVDLASSPNLVSPVQSLVKVAQGGLSAVGTSNLSSTNASRVALETAIPAVGNPSITYGADGRLSGPNGGDSSPVGTDVAIGSEQDERSAVQDTEDGEDSVQTRVVPDPERDADGAEDARGQIREEEPSRGNGSTDNEGSAQGQREAEQIAELAARDREVRAHERAHQAVGGQYAGSVSYAYQTGPDGKRYAVGGEVPIDVSPVPGDPRATIEKMRVVKAAATAPADPSPQDRNVAATATRILVQAQIELAAQRQAESEAVSTEEGRERFADAARTYEEIIGLGRNDADAADLIDELV